MIMIQAMVVSVLYITKDGHAVAIPRLRTTVQVAGGQVLLADII